MLGPIIFSDLISIDEFAISVRKAIEENLIPDWASFLVQFGALVIMLIVGFCVAYKPIKKLLKKRADYIENNIRESEFAMAEANKNAVASQEMILASKKEAADIVNEAKVNAENLKKAKVEETAIEINKMKALAEEDIERSKEEAKEEIRREMVSIALFASEEILKREINGKDNSRIVEDFIKEID